MTTLTGFIPIATDSEGRNVPDAYLYSYEAGTYSPKDTYSDNDLITPNPNPLQSDGAGRFFDVYLDSGGYRLEVRNSAGVVLWQQDNYYPAADTGDIAALEALIAANGEFAAKTLGVYTDSGAADAYVLTYAGAGDAPTAYATNMLVAFKPTNANTGASVVDVEGLGSKALNDENGNALAANFLETTAYYTFIYNGSQFRFFSKAGLVDTGYIADGAVTTAKLATSAALGNLVDATVPLAKLANGTANNLIAYNSSGTPTTVKNPMRLLASGSITAVSNIAFVLSTLETAQSANNAYLIKLVGFQPAGDDVDLYLTLSTDAGATYASTNYEAIAEGYDSSATLRTAASAAAAQITVGGSATAGKAFSNAAGETAVLEMTLYSVNTSDSVRPNILWSLGYFNADGAMTRQSGSGSRTTAGDYDAVKFTWESGGNFAAVGAYYIFAIPNAS